MIGRSQLTCPWRPVPASVRTKIIAALGAGGMGEVYIYRVTPLGERALRAWATLLRTLASEHGT